jgi:hypothetical protein
MADIIFVSIALYLLYRLIFDLILPIYKTTQQVKQKFTDIHQNTGREKAHAFRPQSSAQEKPNPGKPKTGFGEYIDFEEVKQNSNPN